MKNQTARALTATIDRHVDGLRRLRDMWLDPHVLFYEDTVPEKRFGDEMIFLAGPTSRDGIPDYMWRKDAIFYLRQYGCQAKILVPEPRGLSHLADKSNDDFTDAHHIHEWEYAGIRRAHYLVFWVPRNLEQLLGITTNREYGQALGRAEYDATLSRNLYVGWPGKAKKMGSLQFELEKAGVGRLKGGHFSSLDEMCKNIATNFVVTP